MTYEAQEIVRLLRAWPGMFVSQAEIARKANRVSEALAALGVPLL